MSQNRTAINDKPFEVMPWQQTILDIVQKAREEGRTQVRFVHGRRATRLIFVAPDSGSSTPGGGA